MRIEVLNRNLIEATSSNDLTKALRYIKLGANIDINAKANPLSRKTLSMNPDKMSPLRNAIFNGSFEMVKLLVENGANVQIIKALESNTNALTNAVLRFNSKIIKYLFKHSDYKLNEKLFLKIAYVSNKKVFNSLLDNQDNLDMIKLSISTGKNMDNYLHEIKIELEDNDWVDFGKEIRDMKKKMQSVQVYCDKKILIKNVGKVENKRLVSKI